MRDGNTETMSLITTALLGVILTSLVLITIVGNVLVCLSVILVRKLRKPQNYLLVSLAVSDLFVALFVMPFAIVFELNNASWPLSTGICDLYVSADVLSCTASILNLCAISVDRYQAITRPLEYSGTSSPRRMLAVIFAVWLSAACVSLPPVLLLGNEHGNEQHRDCTVSQNFWYQMYATIAAFYLPLCVMVVVYAKILRVVSDKKKQMTWANNSRSSSVDRSGIHVDMHYLQEGQEGALRMPSTSFHNHDHPPDSNNRTVRGSMKTRTMVEAPVQLRIHQGSGRQARTQEGDQDHSFRSLHKFKPLRLKDHKASTTLGIIMSAFIICWLPFFVLAVIRPFFDEKSGNTFVPGWLSSLFLWLGYFNSSLNPVIYATTNRDFRRPFREILCFRCSTLDDLMRREFYTNQYGGDEYCVRNKKKPPAGEGNNGNDVGVGVGGQLSPTSVSETNILTNNAKINNANSTSSPLQLPKEASHFQAKSKSETNTPVKVRNQHQHPSLHRVSSSSNGQDASTRSPWTARRNVNISKTLETQLTTDQQDETDGESGKIATWSPL